MIDGKPVVASDVPIASGDVVAVHPDFWLEFLRERAAIHRHDPGLSWADLRLIELRLNA